MNAQSERDVREAEERALEAEAQAANFGWDGATCRHCRSSECDGRGCGLIGISDD